MDEIKIVDEQQATTLKANLTSNDLIELTIEFINGEGETDYIGQKLNLEQITLLLNFLNYGKKKIIKSKYDQD